MASHRDRGPGRSYANRFSNAQNTSDAGWEEAFCMHWTPESQIGNKNSCPEIMMVSDVQIASAISGSHAKGK